MSRIIYDTKTGNDYPYPRKDGGPVIGLDPGLVTLAVIREPQPQPGEGFSIREADPVDDLQAGTRTIGWIVERLPDPEPVAQWVAFGAVVMETPQIKALLNQAIAIGEAPLAMGLAVGLGKAADGDARVFLGAWGKALAGGLIGAELVASMQALGTFYDLPSEFIAGLAPPRQP